MKTSSLRALIEEYWGVRPIPGTDYCPMVDLCFACQQDHTFRGREVCHVVPDALGGSLDPANLVLLCTACHEAAPDVADPRHMWEWIANADRSNSWIERPRRVLAQLSPATVEAMAGMSTTELDPYLAEAIASLKPVRHYGKPTWSDGTWVAIWNTVAELVSQDA